MNRPYLLIGAMLGALTSLPLMALFYLGSAFAGLPFLPFVLFDWLARVLPGDVITIGIDAIVKTISVLDLGSTSEAAKQLEQLMALGLVLGGGALLGFVIAWLRQRRIGESGKQIGAISGLAVFAIAFVAASGVGFNGDPTIGLLWMAGLLVGWGAFLGHWIESETLSGA
ncbi:MAG: hypothetical protein ACRDIB_08770, partial [Ardenticatenaceae bacterium]